jgi:hypothetical protein
MQKEIKVINGQTIFDLALYCYNDAGLVYNLIAENTIITDISMDLTGLTLVYTPKEIVKFEAKQNAKKLNKLVTIKSEQSLFDLSLQYYGDISFIYDLIQKNSFIENILVNDVNGNIIELENIKDYVTEFYNKKDLTIGTNTVVKNFLLQENGFFLLQENGSKILL